MGIAAAAAALRYAEVRGGRRRGDGDPGLAAADPGLPGLDGAQHREGADRRRYGKEQLHLPGRDQGRRRRSCASTPPRLAGGRSFIYHLAEGTAPALLGEYADLREAGCVHPNLIGIHSTALGDGGVRRLGRQRAPGTIVWSPFSNIWLYGDTTDVLAARRHGAPRLPRLGLGAVGHQEPARRAEGRRAVERRGARPARSTPASSG